MTEWFSENDIREVKENIDEERKKYAISEIEIYPLNNQLFRCFSYFSPENTKVVILGQDPYHGPGQAIGLAFGVNNSQKLPPSLRNIAKELRNDLGIELGDQTLENWAKQGVLLLNSSLSVIQGNPGSHMKYWTHFINHILSILAKQERIIFVAWGKFAYDKLVPLLTREEDSLLVSSHPSPLSANRPFKQFSSFIGSNPFSKINNILKNFNKTPIVW
jgi:uracil-DNA glycosylase